MKNFRNCLMGIEIEEDCFAFLRDELLKNFKYTSFADLLALPCMQHDVKNKLALLFALFEDNICNDEMVDNVCGILANIPTSLWNAFKENLVKLIELKHSIFSRRQKLCFAHTIEIMYAKGYEGVLDLVKLIYYTISQDGEEFNPDSDENIRIKLAKIAYSTNQYNHSEKHAQIKLVKNHIKISGRKYLMGILNYYKGLCMKHGGVKINYKDSSHFIIKSKNKDFMLANVYLNYNIETSNWH